MSSEHETLDPDLPGGGLGSPGRSCVTKGKTES